MNRVPDLRAHVRAERTIAPEIVIARGGPDTIEKLHRHAERLRRAFVLDGGEVLGVSVYAALDDVGPASFDVIVGQKLGSHRWIHLAPAAELHVRGFDLLPTFERPHFTVLVATLDDLGQLVDTLGVAQPNPRYGHQQRRTRRPPR